MKEDIDNFKPVEGLGSKPFYLTSPKSNKRVMITFGLILALMGVLNPAFFAILIIYIVYCMVKIKNNKTEYNILLSESIDNYTSGNFIKSSEQLTKLLELNSKDERTNILLALVKYHQGDYGKVIELFSNVKKSTIESDLDLQMKLADSYLKLDMKTEAKEMYEKLLKVNSHSKYLKDKIDSLS